MEDLMDTKSTSTETIEESQAPSTPQWQFSASLNFLSSAASTGFGGPGHVYDAALSVIVFLECYHPREAASALDYLSNQQNEDGGFSDVSRSSPSSNALDTGSAAVALQYAIREEVIIHGPVNQPP